MLIPRGELRDFALEVLIYFSLVVIYFFAVLAVLEGPLFSLFQSDLILYSVLGLSVLLAQAVALEWVTSQIIRRVKGR
ncbi:MAG: hypothetical protein ACE5KH_01550 [Candidatus Geothermarchaeales archaeon]